MKKTVNFKPKQKPAAVESFEELLNRLKRQRDERDKTNADQLVTKKKKLTLLDNEEEEEEGTNSQLSPLLLFPDATITSEEDDDDILLSPEIEDVNWHPWFSEMPFCFDPVNDGLSLFLQVQTI